MRFEGKVAIVTGAGSGIGLATARLLAAEGATVAVNDLRGETVEAAVSEITGAGGHAFPLPGDIADREQVQASAREVVRRCGRIDILVNNAGLPVPGAAETYAGFGRSLDVNLGGALNWSQSAAVESMIPNKSGAIVIVSSLAGLVAVPGDIGYVVSKHGLLGMAKALCIEWAQHGIRVNCVAPGVTASTMVNQAINDHPVFMAERIGRVPLGRIAQPEDQAKAVLFLASDDAAYISGVTLPVDGGQMALHSGFTKSRK